MYQLLKAIVEGRSTKWPALRRSILKECCECAACGRKERLEAHHIIPFHINKALELVRSNIIVLCFRCHFMIGHFDDWKMYNPNVVAEATRWRKAKEAALQA